MAETCKVCGETSDDLGCLRLECPHVFDQIKPLPTHGGWTIEARARALCHRLNAPDCTCEDVARCDSGMAIMEALSAPQPRVGREEIARVLYKSRGQFDDATVKLHFDWFQKPVPIQYESEGASLRLAIVHCYRDAAAILSLPASAGEGWQPIETAPELSPEDNPIDLYGARMGRATGCYRCEGKWISVAADGAECELDERRVTHWMPRPRPPSEGKP